MGKMVKRTVKEVQDWLERKGHVASNFTVEEIQKAIDNAAELYHCQQMRVIEGLLFA